MSAYAFVATGDVIEFDLNGTAQTALVLLSSSDMMILDMCDGEVPMVVDARDLGEVRVFDPMLLAA